MLGPNTVLKLGSFEFQQFEIPTLISGFGASQTLAVHRSIGGDRTVDSMGKDYEPISWSGLFQGVGAADRMNTLKALVDGSQQNLTVHDFNYAVVIRQLSCDDRQSFEIPYRIVCEVVADNSNTLNPIGVSAADVLSEDMDSANSLADIINDSTLGQIMAQVTSAMAQVTSTIGQGIEITDTIEGSILAPITAAITQVKLLSSGAEGAISAEAGFAGMAVGEDAAQIAAQIIAVNAAMFDDLNCLDLLSLLDRMVANLNSLRSSPNSVSVAGGNLFQIAAQQYGDASAWSSIAASNDLTDPFIVGIANLTIPLTPADTGGVLNK